MRQPFISSIGAGQVTMTLNQSGSKNTDERVITS